MDLNAYTPPVHAMDLMMMLNFIAGYHNFPGVHVMHHSTNTDAMCANPPGYTNCGMQYINNNLN